MADDPIPPDALATLGLVARAIRDELGEEIDAYPSPASPADADPLNRAYRAVARALLGVAGVGPDRLAPVVSRTLRRLADRRLLTEGWDDDRVERLIADEPGSPDDWLAFLILSSRAQIEPWLDREPG